MALLITDPVGRLLKANGDIDRTNGRSSLARGLAGVVQGARTRILLIRGEWFLNLSVGVPWFARYGVLPAQAILGQRFSPIRIRAELRRAILATPGVLGIASLEVGFDATTRSASVTWSARTIWGDTDPDTLERRL